MKMLFKHNILAFVIFNSIAICTQAQFWKLNSLSELDLFILETRSAMSSGICYKEVPGKTSDPDLRMRMVSYCCPGYRRHADARSMKCEPICEEDCTNGICSAPDICQCYPGYQRRGGHCEEN